MSANLREYLQRLAEMLTNGEGNVEHIASKLRSLARSGPMLEGAWEEFQEPPVGAIRHCIVCARYGPWGIWDSKTGATVCVSCREAARGG